MRIRTYKNIALSNTAIAIATAGTVMMMAGCANTADYTGDDASSPAASEAATADDAETAATEAIELDGGQIGMPSPIVDYATLEEAEQAAGFEITVPDSIDGYDTISYSVISDELIQVIYSSDDASITIRKASTSVGEDISGDYNVYAEEQTQEMDGKQVTLRGDNDYAALAIWTDGDYSYSVMSSEGAVFSAEEIGTIVMAVK